MKRVVLLIGLIVLLGACSQQAIPATETPHAELTAQAGSWQKLGGALDFTASKNTVAPQLVLDRQGQVVAAWGEYNNGLKIYLERWTSAGWQSFGAGLPVGGTFPFFSVAFDKTNNVVIGVVDDNTVDNSTVTIYKRDNVTKIWSKIASPFKGSYKIVTDRDGAAHRIIYNDQTKVSTVQRWNGSIWQEVYARFQQKRNDGTNARADALGFLSNGAAYLTWYYPGATERYWSTLAFDGTVSRWATQGSLGEFHSLGKQDIPYLGKIDCCATGLKATVQYLGSNLGSPIPISSGLWPTMTVNNSNQPVIAYGIVGNGLDNNDSIAEQWNGTSWVRLGGIVDRVAGRDTTINSLIVDNKNALYAAWVECFEYDSTTRQCKNTNIYVSKYIP